MPSHEIKVSKHSLMRLIGEYNEDTLGDAVTTKSFSWYLRKRQITLGSQKLRFIHECLKRLAKWGVIIPIARRQYVWRIKPKWQWPKKDLILLHLRPQ